MEHSSPNTHMQYDTQIDSRKKINTWIAGNTTNYNNLRMQEPFDNKILTLSNFVCKKFGATSPSDTW